MLFAVFFAIIGALCLVLSFSDFSLLLFLSGIFCLGFGLFGIWFKIKEEDEKIEYTKSVKEERGRLLKERNLMNSNWITDMNSTICAIDEVNETVYFYYFSEDMKYSTSRSYSYKDILETEVLVDGETITKTSRGSQIGGALIGGVLAGGVGAVIGGLSGSAISKEKVGSIQLKITVNDINNPIILLKIFYTNTPWDKNDEELKQYSDTAMAWQGHFAVIINIADKKVEVKTENNISDEIRKLHKLLKDGILTEDEFNTQKQKILIR